MSLSLYAIDFLSFELMRLLPRFPEYVVKTVATLIPTVGYLDVMRMMYTSKTQAGYNMRIVLIMLTSNGLKLTYYYFDPFSDLIFSQSLSVFITMFILTYLYFHYTPAQQSTKQQNSSRLPIQIFRIASSTSFGAFMTSFLAYTVLTVAVFAVLFLVFGREMTCSTFSLVANLVDSTVSIPLFIKVVVHRIFENVSMVMVVQYFSGDVTKLLFFRLSHTKWPFYVGGFIQLILDLSVVIVFFASTLHHEEKTEDPE